VLRQLASEEVRGSFEPAADLASSVRDVLEHAGVAFIEETEFDGPGPTQRAAVALDDGRQYLLVHHYAHPESFVELRAPAGHGSPAEVTDRFIAALTLPAAVVTWVAETWPRPTES
jgi:hypothetical protein